MVADKVLSAKDVEVEVVEVVEVAWTTCRILPPPEAVAHFKPVAVELSATSICASDPTAKRATVDAAVALIRSPLAVNSVG